MGDFFELYDALIDNIDDGGERISSAYCGSRWSAAEYPGHLGMAMFTPGESMPAEYPEGPEGLTVRAAAETVKSWNFREAGMGLAACNAYFNSSERMEKLNAYEPYENYSTAGLDMEGRTVGLIGHLHLPERDVRKVKEIHIIERDPQLGDYPDSACDWILPRCDLVLITGSTIVNKTLPHLLELCRNACTILTGPSVPMCPALLDFGIDRLAGLIVDDFDSMRSHIKAGKRGNPYFMGQSFLLKK
ncbi:MAG: Rossmann-like domain-containing protein [Candidatus Limivicinus sp.]|jgi:uncharacterized protein (DUF4213/DUF364 family)